MNLKISFKNQLALLVSIQLILTIFTFWEYFKDPVNFVFQKEYDGQHSNFTYISHLQQNKDKSIWKLDQQNYPFGDYIFYQDNPLTFTLPYKFINDYLYDLKPFGFAFYNFIHLSGVLISSIFLFLILSRFIRNPYWIILGAIALSWTNPQIHRFYVGHYSLSYSWIMTGGLYILIRIIESGLSNKKWYFILIMWIFLSSYCHFYYLALLAALICPTLIIFSFLQNEDENINSRLKKVLIECVKMVGVLIVSYILILIPFLLFDGYNELRDSGSSGYGYIPWKFNLSYFYSANSFIKIPFLVRYFQIDYYESFAYLGTFALFLLTFVLIHKFFNSSHKFNFLSNFSLDYKKLWLGLTISGLIALAISLGDNYEILEGKYLIQNYFNPLRYLQKISTMFTQFRCLGRFIWVWWWPLAIFMIIIANNLTGEHSKKYIKYFVYALSILIFTDTKDYINLIRSLKSKDTITNIQMHDEFRKRYSSVNFENFQSILPLPYYHVGVSDMNLTIDGTAEQYIEMNSFSNYSKLPLMSMQNARSIIPHNQALFSIFLKDTIDQGLISKLNEKSVLVIVKKNMYSPDGKTIHPEFRWIERRPAYDVTFWGQHIVEKFEMTKLIEDEKFTLYKWDMKNNFIKKKDVASFSKIAFETYKSEILKSPEWINIVKTNSAKFNISEDSSMYIEVVKLIKNPF